MKLAIVGTSKISARFDIETALKIIQKELSHIPQLIISGGAEGIDSMAVNTAKLQGIQTVTYPPLKPFWKYYKMRNKLIAKACDELVCITTKTQNERCYHCNADHQRTGGCWTMKKTKELGKTARLYVV